MLLSWFFDIGYTIAKIICSIIPQMPDLPEKLHNSLFSVIDILFDNGGNLISLFIRIDTIKIVVPVLIVIINFDKVYQVFMWAIKKIPLLSMK